MITRVTATLAAPLVRFAAFSATSAAIALFGRRLDAVCQGAAEQGLQGKTLAIRLREFPTDLLVHIGRDQLHPAPGPERDVCIKGSAADFLKLMRGEEDADSLFFSGRLLMTGDTEVGVLLKNVLAESRG